MPKAPRTFKLPSNPKTEKIMKGDDVKEWQKDVKASFKKMGIDCPIAIDGTYGQQTRAFSAALCKAHGLASNAMVKGVTPELRVKLRNLKLTNAEKKAKNSKARKDYRAKLRKQWKVSKVHAPVSKIVTDDWGYHPGVHDGVDVQSIRGAAAFAMVKSKIIDVRTGDWWGNNPSGNVSLGDGIVQMEVLETVGPFKKGMHIGFGHLEQPKDHPVVKVGQIVEAGHIVGIVGLAVTPHIHLMVNSGNTSQGRGTQDPRPLLNYAVKNG